MKPLRLLALLIAVLIGVWAYFQPRPSTPASSDAPKSDVLSDATSDTEPIRASDPAPTLESTNDPSAPAPTESPAATWTLQGLALSTVDQAGIAGLKVTLSHPAGAAQAATSSVSDGLGAFVFELDERHWKRGEVRLASVHDAASGARRFQGLVRLDPNFAISIQALTGVRGRVLTSLAPRDPRLDVTFWRAPQRASREWTYVARTVTDTTGWFECDLALAPSVDLLRVDIALDGVHCASFDTPLDALRSPSGVELNVELGELRLSVADENGAAVVGAELRIAAWGGSPDNFPPVAATDARGQIMLRLPPAHYEFALGKAGHCSRVEFVEIAPQPVELELQLARLGEEHELFGVVVDERGEPVPAAFVAVGPRTQIDELGAAGTHGVRTDEFGNFRLRSCSSQELELTAFHRDFGLSTPLLVTPDGTRLVVALARRGKVQIDVLTDPLPGPFRDGECDYVFVPQAGGESIFGVADTLPFEVDELLVGDYDVFVVLSGLDGCAEGFVRVEAARTAQALIPARRAHWISGRALDAQGSALPDLQVRALARWPAAAAQALSWGTTLGDGSFRVFCDASEADLLLEDLNGELLRQQVREGESIELRTP
jgi:hypothetical protein